MVVCSCFPVAEYFPWCVGQTGSRIVSSLQSAFAGLAVLNNMPVWWTTSWEDMPSPVRGLGLLHLCWCSSGSPPRGIFPGLCLLFSLMPFNYLLQGNVCFKMAGTERAPGWLHCLFLLWCLSDARTLTGIGCIRSLNRTAGTRIGIFVKIITSVL